MNIINTLFYRNTIINHKNRKKKILPFITVRAGIQTYVPQEASIKLNYANQQSSHDKVMVKKTVDE